MQFRENNVELPTQYLNTPYSFTALLQNNLPQQIHIHELRPGCGACTTASLDKYILEEGEQTMLRLTYTPGATGEYIPKAVSLRYMYGNQENILIFNFHSKVVA